MSRRRDSEDIRNFHDYSIDISSRTIYVGSEQTNENLGENGVDFVLSERVIKNLHILETQGSGDISIILNSPGGEVEELFAIYDKIKSVKNFVTITGFGKIYSAAGYLMQAANKRIMSPNTFFMLHEGYCGHATNHPRIIKQWQQFYDKQDEILFNIYLSKIREKNPDFSEKKLEKMLMFDTILSAVEAKELNLIDEVLE
jgi:ATP-dependent Clp protease protease subunit